MLSESKLSKYLLYAIGEIVLVVIGILLALQINNWNENRKLQRQEVNTLRQLNVDLKSNLEEIQSIYANISRSTAAGPKILNHLDSGAAVDDSLLTWIEAFGAQHIFNNANTTYKNLETSNASQISNDSLRLRITIMYERYFFNIHKRESSMKERYMHRYQDQLHRNFKTGPRMSAFLDQAFIDINTPRDLAELRENHDFLNALADLHNYRLLRSHWLEDTLTHLEKLVEDIEAEIAEMSAGA